MISVQEMIDATNKQIATLEIQQETRKMLAEQIKQDRQDLEKLREEKKNHEEASAALLKFLEACRDKSKSVFEDLGTTALESVFGENYALEISYDVNRNSSVADINISIPTKYDENIVVSLDQCGGGMIDLVSMVFCISQLELLHPRLEGPILSDEYFKFLSDDLRAPAAEVLRETLNPDMKGANGKGRQLLMITHAKEFLEYADKIFHFRKVGDRTSVEDITSRYIEVIGTSEIAADDAGEISG